MPFAAQNVQQAVPLLTSRRDRGGAPHLLTPATESAAFTTKSRCEIVLTRGAMEPRLLSWQPQDEVMERTNRSGGFIIV
jgi:hypothetical protein